MKTTTKKKSATYFGYIQWTNFIIYIVHICSEYENIYIEVRSCFDGELQMTIDAKKIIPKLSVPLEDEEWEKLEKKKLGALIRETWQHY